MQQRERAEKYPTQVYELSSTPIQRLQRGSESHSFHTLRLMRVFVTRRNKALTHHELLQAVWGA
jgi:hypothetical protein